MYYLLYRRIALRAARRLERLSMFVAEVGYTARQQRDMDIIYIPEDLEILE